MKTLFIFTSILNVICFFMHEFDAFYEREWKMFSFLKPLNDKIQYLIFLYSHILLSGFLFYYLWCIYSFENKSLWIIVNTFGVLHFIIHLIARKWESNVFKSFSSFLFIGGTAITGVINILLMILVKF
jgi:hypothetical protein